MPRSPDPEWVLEKHGPLASGDVIARLKAAGLSGPAARQRVSRHPAVRGLRGIRLPHNERFLYLESQYNRPGFWAGLISTLKSKHSVYGACIAALEMRGGSIPASRFASISGSPNRLKGQLSPETILKRLTSLGLLAKHEIAGSPITIQFGRNVPGVAIGQNILRARALAEGVMLSALREWLRNNGLGSYDKVRLRAEEVEGTMPEYGHFEWDLTAPCYMHPIAIRKVGSIKPGFVVADVVLGVEADEDGVGAFVKKVASIQGQRIPQALTMFIADRFSPEAWRIGRQRGIWFTTPAHILGRDAASGLESLINVLSNAAAATTGSWDRVEEMLKKLSKIEGAAMNIRGALFELAVGGAIHLNGFGSIDIRETVASPDGQVTDIDILAVKGKSQVTAFECKGKEPRGRVSLQEVDKWLTDQVPIIVKWIRAQDRFVGSRICVEFWTSGLFDDDARSRLDQARIEIKKYDINYKDGPAVREFVRMTRDKGRISVYEEHFCSHPLA